MTIRELLIRIGFSVDRSGASQAYSAMGGLENRAKSLGSAIGAIGGALGMAFALKEVFQMADAWANVEARIGLVTKGVEDQQQTFDKVYDLSNKTRQSFETTGDLFYKLSNASHDFEASQEDVLRVTETVNKALVAGGASTQEAKATVLQLGQALASGRLQGDELRSLDENASNLMREVAKNFGVTIGQLKKMGAEGKLTSKEVFEAIKKSSDVIDKQFEQMPTTIGQAVTVSMNIVGKFFRDIGKETNVFKGIAGGVVWVFSTMDIGIRKIVASVGGFRNAIKLLGVAVLGLSVAFTALKWAAIVEGIIAIRTALLGLLLNPATWIFIAIAAAVILVSLALEDLYYWITGGESVLGKYLGSWQDFKTKVITWVTDIKNAVFDWLTTTLTAFAQWASTILTGFAQWSSGLLSSFSQWVASMIAGFVGFFSNIGNMWTNMRNWAINTLNDIIQYVKNLFSFLNPVSQIISKMTGLNFNMSTSSNLGMADAAARNSNITINQTNQLLAGTPAGQVNFVQQSTEDMFNQNLVTSMQYGI